MKTLKKIAIVFLFLNAIVVKSQDMIITNARIVNIEKGIVESPQNIYIKNGEIQKLTKTDDSNKIKSNGKVIDAKGSYVLPGFVESHAHVAMGPVNLEFDENKKPALVMEPSVELTEKTLKLLLANGVTTTRDPGGLTEKTVKAKRDIKSGKLLGPELLVAGSIIDTLNFKNLTVKVKTTDDIITEINSQKENGVDFIKLYSSLSPELLKAGIEHSRKLGLKSIAHLHSTSWTEAADLKVDNIVHIMPGNENLLPKDKRKEYLKYANLGVMAHIKWFEYVDLDGKEIREAIKALKENNVSVDPTLVVFHAAFFGDSGEYQSQEELKYLPGSIVKNWKTTFNFNLGWREDDFQIAHKVWGKVEKFIRMLHENGIMLTAGTDANNPFIVPGYSFHQELELLKSCGLSNREILEIAITNGAKLLGLEKRVGKIKEGYEADLILLKKNPLIDIKNTSSVLQIIVNGEQYSKEDILNTIK
ncbi:amidohydrolase family protein [Leptobacterium flavescens]|uniref:Amidohydrolase family protein n=1 Tax=Leptobacterium flavescens TaxID=472055 RepID=A0A6P0UQS3_9FLAO|nr:amidohydrolase family protein [Leptobacterium flavescens]NER12756.1 amidohydrolase family protein [Leptobacterium flavescens]